MKSKQTLPKFTVRSIGRLNFDGNNKKLTNLKQKCIFKSASEGRAENIKLEKYMIELHIKQ